MDEEAQPLTSGSGIPRVRSIEQPLTGGGGGDSAPPATAPPPPKQNGAHQLVPSSLDDEKVCRFCLENTDHPTPFHANHLIAPCQCRGSSRWVHRGCLDEWRATQQDRAFSSCTECFFGYEFDQPESEVGSEEGGAAGENGGGDQSPPWLTLSQRRSLKFRLFVARDVVGYFVLMQLAILFLGGLVRWGDCNTGSFWDCAAPLNASSSDSYYAHADDAVLRYGSADGASECCPEGSIVNSWPFGVLHAHTRTAYYLVGLMLFSALFGVFCTPICSRMCGDGSANQCCFGVGSERCCSYPLVCFGVGCRLCGMGTMCQVLLISVPVLLLVMSLIVTVAGAMAAAMFLSLLVQRSMQRHVAVLHKRNLATQHFIVEDLSGEGGGCRSLEQVLADRGGAAENPALQLRQSQVTRAAREMREAANLARREAEDAEADADARVDAEDPPLLPQGARRSAGARAVLDQRMVRQSLREVGGL
jgi:hypothetical protein